jgi:hypothetical protein
MERRAISKEEILQSSNSARSITIPIPFTTAMKQKEPMPETLLEPLRMSKRTFREV